MLGWIRPQGFAPPGLLSLFPCPAPAAPGTKAGASLPCWPWLLSHLGNAAATPSPPLTPCHHAVPCLFLSPWHSGLTPSSYSPPLQLWGPCVSPSTVLSWGGPEACWGCRGQQWLGDPLSRGGLARPSPCKATSPPPPFLEEIMQIPGGGSCQTGQHALLSALT